MRQPDFGGLETARLFVRPFRDADLDPFMAYRNDPEVARYQGWESISASQAYAFVQEMKAVRPGIPGRWFQFAFELKATGTLIGDCALKFDEPEARQAELGYTLARAYHGQGLASEGVSSVLDYAFGTLRLHRILALVDCRNTASVALVERLGMRREGHFLQSYWYKGAWADEYQYATLRDEWLRRRV